MPNAASDAAQRVERDPEREAVHAYHHPGPTAGGAPVHRLRFGSRGDGCALGDRYRLGSCAAGTRAGPNTVVVASFDPYFFVVRRGGGVFLEW
jgi:hypothetical protein